MVARFLFVDVAVMVPAAVTDEYEPGAGVCLKQVTREDHRVTETAVAVARAILVTNREDARDARVVHDAPGAAVVLVITRKAAVGTVALAKRTVELLQALPAPLHRVADAVARDHVRRAVGADAHVHRAELGGQKPLVDQDRKSVV